ncbi:MAG: lamin tail domain-containing protein [Sporichthyaceae bacterium]
MFSSEATEHPARRRSEPEHTACKRLDAQSHLTVDSKGRTSMDAAKAPASASDQEGSTLKIKAAIMTTLVAVALLVGGASADAVGGVRFTMIYYDSPGAGDGSNSSVNAERFTVKNYGTRARSLAGWTVRDHEGHVYRFPNGFRLPAGRTVTVHTGKGSSTGLHRYWGQNHYVWNNTADTAVLRNRAGTKIDGCRWTAVGDGVCSSLLVTAPAPTAFQGPLTITSGGTYTGRYESTVASRPAVTIATSEPVVLSHMTVRHKGSGVFAQSTRANVTIVNSSFKATNPGSVEEQWDVYAFQPKALVVEHNTFVDGHGVTIDGNNVTTSPFRINFNDFVDVGRYDATEMVGPVHTDKVLAPGGQVQWNRSTATYGRSVIEDAFGFSRTNGGAGDPLDIGHNLVNGAYPHSGNGSDFTGGAFDLGDGGGSWLLAHDNTAVNYTNNGFMIPSGHDIEHRNSVAVYDGRAGFSTSGPVVSSTFGNGVTTWHNPSYPPSSAVTVTGMKAGHRRLNGSWQRADYNLPVGATAWCRTSSASAAAELTAVDAFESSARAAGVTIGAP